MKKENTIKPSVVKMTDRKIHNRLEAWFKSASTASIVSGISWYSEAQETASAIGKQFDIDPYIAATVISSLSPHNKWERNASDAWAVCACWYAGKGPESVKVCTFNKNKEKAFRALEGELIAETAPKTHSFSANIGRLSSDHITIDMWMVRACLTLPNEEPVAVVEGITAVQYRRLERIASTLAKKHSLKGFQFQAIVWVTIKKRWEGQ